jgi:hypothetical protein
MLVKGIPATWFTRDIPSSESFTWLEYFSVAARNGGDLLVRSDFDVDVVLDDPLHARAEVLAVLVQVGFVDHGADGDDLLGGARWSGRHHDDGYGQGCAEGSDAGAVEVHPEKISCGVPPGSRRRGELLTRARSLLRGSFVTSGRLALRRTAQKGKGGDRRLAALSLLTRALPISTGSARECLTFTEGAASGTPPSPTRARMDSQMSRFLIDA